jgi:hypothetical protein
VDAIFRAKRRHSNGEKEAAEVEKFFHSCTILCCEVRVSGLPEADQKNVAGCRV